MSAREDLVLGWVVVCGDGTILAESIGGVPIFNDYGDAGAQAHRVGGHVRPAVKPQFFASESMTQTEQPRRKKSAPVTATAEPASSAHSSNGTQEDDDEDAEAPRVLVGWKPAAIEKETSSSRRRAPASND